MSNYDLWNVFIFIESYCEFYFRDSEEKRLIGIKDREIQLYVIN
jgi:hypothetical protein